MISERTIMYQRRGKAYWVYVTNTHLKRATGLHWWQVKAYHHDQRTHSLTVHALSGTTATVDLRSLDEHSLF